MFLKESCQPLFYKSELVAWNERKHLLEAKHKPIQDHHVHGPCGQKHWGNTAEHWLQDSSGLLICSWRWLSTGAQGPSAGLDDPSESHRPLRLGSHHFSTQKVPGSSSAASAHLPRWASSNLPPPAFPDHPRVWDTHSEYLTPNRMKSVDHLCTFWSESLF